MAAAIAATTVSVDTRCVAGVPCLTCSASQAKAVLALVRASAWHPNNHSRLVLDRRPGKHAKSRRAYQVSDEAAVMLLARRGGGDGDGSADSGGGGGGDAAKAAAAQLLAMIDSGAIRWCPSFQLHEYIIDPSRCDRPGDDEEGHGGGAGGTGAEIRYLPGHALKPELLLSGLPPPPAVAAAAAAPPLADEAGGVAAAVDFSFAELFAGIGGFRVGLEACGGHCVFSSEINPWAKKIYALNFGGAGAAAGATAAAAAAGDGDGDGDGDAPPASKRHCQAAAQPAAAAAAAAEEVVADKIQNVKASSVPYHDLLTAGFPCQPFTGTTYNAGEANGADGHQESRPRGFRDPRGQLFWHMIALIRANKAEPSKQPRGILLENVVGLMKSDISRLSAAAAVAAAEAAATAAAAAAAAGGGEQTSGGGGGDGDESVSPFAALPTVLAALTECGYQVSWRQYNACKLVPQGRSRVYIIGVRNDVAAETQGGGGAGSGGAGAMFTWPELPEHNPTIGSILHQGSIYDDDDAINGGGGGGGGGAAAAAAAAAAAGEVVPQPPCDGTSTSSSGSGGSSSSSSRDSTVVDLEPYRLTRREWEKVELTLRGKSLSIV
jgi:site-specific DNA-cytosine methylase